jgi:uncharacterized membrane protein YbhN (UPF0104 family)
MKSKASVWKTLAKLGLSAGALLILLHRIDTQMILRRLAAVRMDMMLVVLGLTVFQLVLLAWRWRYILRRLGASGFDLARLLVINGVSSFYGQVLPSSVGGDLLRVGIVGRSIGFRQATLSIVMDRMWGVIVLAALAAVTLPLIAVRIGINQMAVAAIEILGAVAGTAVMLYFRGRLARSFPDLAADLARFVESPGPACVLFASSALTTFGAIAVFWAIARSLALPVEFGAALLLLPTALLLSALPISLAGWGVREAAVVTSFSLVGLAPADALTVSVLYGLTTPAMGLVAVLAELAMGLHIRPRAAEDPASSVQ